jgi:hypothetical protein
MSASYTEWYVQCFNTRTKKPIDDDTGVCNVLTANSPVEITIYSDDRGTSASNPLTMTDGVARFWTAASVTSVDLSIMTSTGYAVFCEDFVPSNHRVDINPDERKQLLVIPWLFNNNVETDTGFDFPAKCRINPYELALRVTTADATETIEVGILASEAGGDADGFIDAASIGTAGYVSLIPQICGGGNIDYVTTNYVGVLLATSIAGVDAVATVGGWSPVTNYVTDGTAKSISYTCTAGSDEGYGYIIIGYDRLP